MKAIILAAGIASRLRPLTDNTPKCLLEVAGKSILSRTMDNLSQNGITEFIIVTGYRQEMIKDYLAENYRGVEINYIFNEKFETTNNIYSLWMTKNQVAGEEFMLLDSDILFDKQIIKLLADSGYDNCLALRSAGGIGDEEIKVKISSDGTVEEISKTVKIDDAIGESIGIEKFGAELSGKLFEILDKMILDENKVDIFYEAAFQRAIDEGSSLYPVDVGDLFCMELDTVDDFSNAGNNAHLIMS